MVAAARSDNPEAASPVVEVWTWNVQMHDFEPISARRTAPDTYEVIAPVRAAVDPGDLLRCELSDGELIVHERIWSGRLL